MFLDCFQSLRVLSNLELKALFTVFLLLSVCSCFVFMAIINWLGAFLQQIRKEACDKKNFLIEVALLKKQTDQYSKTYSWRILRKTVIFN